MYSKKIISFLVQVPDLRALSEQPDAVDFRDVLKTLLYELLGFLHAFAEANAFRLQFQT